ncbi:MAG: hypothetical protein J7M08_03190, partial [Planctomycetes bacterium]|nr:hypothetical protein [Planctomycetota bacterium]
GVSDKTKPENQGVGCPQGPLCPLCPETAVGPGLSQNEPILLHLRANNEDARSFGKCRLAKESRS